jgi:hypothetical protein
MTKLMRELEAVLCPMSVAGGQADGDPSGRRPLKVRLRVVRTTIDIDSSELSGRTEPPDFKASGLQEYGEIGGTNPAKSTRLNPKIQWSRIVCSRQRTVEEEERRAENGEID